MLEETFIPLDSAAMTRAQAPVTLTELKIHWGSAYKISLDRERWSARRRDGLGMLTAGSAEELRDEIREDYARLPVPRLMPGSDCYGRILPPRPTGLLARFLRGQIVRFITGQRKGK